MRMSSLWTVIPNITGVVSFIAFVAALGYGIALRVIRRKERLIALAPADQRPILVEQALESLGELAAGLDANQKYDLLKRRLRHQATHRRNLLLFFGILAVMVLLALIATLRSDSAPDKPVRRSWQISLQPPSQTIVSNHFGAYWTEPVVVPAKAGQIVQLVRMDFTAEVEAEPPDRFGFDQVLVLLDSAHSNFRGQAASQQSMEYALQRSISQVVVVTDNRGRQPGSKNELEWTIDFEAPKSTSTLDVKNIRRDPIRLAEHGLSLQPMYWSAWGTPGSELKIKNVKATIVADVAEGD